MLDTFGSTNIGAMGIPETEKKEKEIEKTFKEIMAENLPNLMKNITHQRSSMNCPPPSSINKETQTHTYHSKNAKRQRGNLENLYKEAPKVQKLTYHFKKP